jgi:hypothetical protein
MWSIATLKLPADHGDAKDKAALCLMKCDGVSKDLESV